MSKKIYSVFRFSLPVLLLVGVLFSSTPVVFADTTAFVDGTVASGLAGGNPDCANTANAVTANNSRADCDNTEEVVISNFGIDSLVTAGSTGIGFVVQAEAYTSNDNGSDSFSVDLSWNGGTTFTTSDPSTDQINNESFNGDQTIQAPDNATCSSFGRTWSLSELTNTNFRARLTSSTDGTLFLDRVQIQVCYTPPPTPNLSVVKTNNAIGGTVPASGAFNWTLVISNTGTLTASFADTNTILTDNLPNTNATYGTPSVITAGGVTGTVSCGSIVNSNLSCTASGAVTIPVGGTVTITVPVTAGVTSGTLVNPRAGGVCSVDPSLVVAESNEGNNACSNTVTVDGVAPTVTIDLQPGSDSANSTDDLTNATNLIFDVNFNETVLGFTISDYSGFTNTGTATGCIVSNVTGSIPNFDVTVSSCSEGTLILTVPAGAANDNGNNPNALTIGPTVTIDRTGPTVTIDQALGQTDPTSTPPIDFTVVFSESVSGFTNGDLTLTAGTAGGTKTGTVTLGPTTYNVAVNGMTTPGTIIATVNAGAVTDTAGNPSTASTSGDNTVTWNPLTDLTINKTSSTGTNATNGETFNYVLTATNSGSSATFTSGQTILSDNIQSSGNPIIGTITPANGAGTTGTVVCSINGTNDLTCSASGGDVVIPPTGTITITIPVTVTSTTTLVNPRSGGTCFVDPAGNITESNEGNNACPSISVSVTANEKNIVSATVNGSSSTTIAPGATISTVANLTSSGSGTGNDWLATSWRISTTPPGSTACVDTSPDRTTAVTNQPSNPFNITAPVTPGTYNLYLIAKEFSDCTGQVSPIFTLLNAVVVKLTPTISVSNSPVTYNGSAQAAIILASTTGAVTDVKYNGSSTVPTDVGTYAITADFTPDDTTTYNSLNDAAAGNFVIDQADSATVISCPASVVYNSLAQTPCTANVTGANLTTTTTVVYGNNTNVGTATANAVYAGDLNHTGSTALEVTFEITKATATCTIVGDSDTYDGNPHGATGTCLGVGDVVLSGLNLGATFTDVPGGNANWTFTNANYNDQNNSVVIEILPLELTGNFTADNKVYDGNNLAIILTRTLPGVIGLDDVELVGGTATFDNANVGTGKTVTFAGGVLDGDDIGNYTLGIVNDTTADITIAPSVTTVTCPVSETYTGSPITPCTANVVGDGGLNESVDVTYEDNTDVGTATANATYAGDVNHTGSSDSETFAITPKSLTISVVASDKVYNANNVSIVVLSNDALLGDDIVVTDTGATFSDKNVGTGKTVTATFTVTGTDAGNYTATPSPVFDTADITPYTGLLATATADDKVYDGNTTATVALSFGNIFSGDDVSPLGYTSATFDDQNVGTNKIVTVTGITGTGADIGNYTWNTSDTDLADITQASSTTVVTCPVDVVYDSSAQEPCTVSVTGAGGLSLTPDPIYVNNTDVGTANASYTFAGDENHTGSSDDTNFEIIKASSEVTITCPASEVYTGSAIEPCTANVVGDGGLNESVDVTYENNVDTGTATANATYAGDTNHTGDTGEDTFDIVQAGSTTVISCPTDVAYNGLAQEPCTANVTGAGLVSVTTPVTYGNNTNAGTATANAVYGGDLNHTGSTALEVTFEITAISVSVEATADNKPYDGLTDASATVDVVGEVDGDDVTATFTDADFDTADMGTGKTVTVLGIALTGADAGNYTLANESDTTLADITSISVSVVATANDKPYDGNTDATFSLDVVGEVDGDDVTATGGTGVFDNENVGTDKTVTVTGYTLAGADAGNYTLSNPSDEDLANIGTIEVTVVATAADKTYDGNDTATFTLDVEGEVLGDDVTATGGTGVFDNANAGTGKTVTVSGYTLAGTNADNYTLSNPSDEDLADIFKAEALILVNEYHVEFDNLAHTSTGSATGVNAEDLSSDLDLSGTTHTSAGVYNGDAWTFTDTTGNYNDDAGTVNNSISEAVAVCVVEGAIVNYDGEAHGATGACTGVEGELTGLDLGASFTDVPGGPANWSFSNPNYDSQSGSVEIEILALDLAVTANDNGKVFGDSDPTLTYTLNSGALVSGDSFSGNVAREAGEAVGPYAINQGDLTAGVNYEITFTPGTFTIIADPTITVNKVVINDNGGTLEADDFSFKVNGGSSIAFLPVDPTHGSNAVVVDPGTYTITEVATAGYSTTYENCSDIVVEGAGSAVCTITNDDIAPTLTLNKVVTNNNGGTAVESAWTLTATGATGFSGVGPTVLNGDSFDAGVYTLSENGGPFGYTSSLWTCDDNGDDDNSVTVGLGENVNCTITNDDIAPKLTLVKSVNGGSASANQWILTATGPTSISGAGGVISNGTFSAGVYTLTESTGPVNYVPAATWSCLGSGNVITLNLADVVTCTMVNTFVQPGTITIEKQTLPDGDATEFTFTASYDGDGFTLTDGEQDVSITLVPGTYSVAEGTLPENWSLTSATCSDGSPVDAISLQAGEAVVCTFTNTFTEPLTISDEQAADSDTTSITVTWSTNHDATSRVVYDTVSHNPAGAAPNYDYAFSTVEIDTPADPNGVTSHSVTINGLTPNTQYFFRAVSHGSPEITSDEMTISTDEVVTPPDGDPACSDGEDNDGDDLTDFPSDPGCTDAEDNDEINEVNPPVVDVCDNLPGDQSVPPSGTHIEGDNCVPNEDEEEETPSIAKIYATKILCDVESDLPNWGNGGPNITSDTAEDFLDAHPNCHEIDWSFQWAPSGTLNPGDEIHEGGDAWTTFDGYAEVPTGSLIWVREHAEDGYIPFSGDITAPRDHDVSAEFYCSTDVLNYDNYDFISPVKKDHSYHCVGWNVLEEVACEEKTVTETLVSDTDTLENGDAAVLVDPLHIRWTALIDGASWIWGENPIADGTVDTTETFTKTFEVAGTPTGGNLEIAADNSYTVTLNGTELCSDAEEFNYQAEGEEGHDGQDVCVISADQLVSGENTISFEVKNFGREDAQEGENPAGLLYKLTLDSNECVPPPPVTCDYGQHQEGEECVDDETPECGEGEHLDGDQCVPDEEDETPTECPAGTHLEGEQCVPNDDGSEEETDPNAPQCSDGIDNDGNGKTDWPEDKKSCSGPNDDNENNHSGGRHGGGGGGSGGGYSAPKPAVLGATNTCGIYVDKFLRKGYDNDVEAVKKVQKFLNDFTAAGLVESGIFDQKTEDALKAFQLAHKDKVLTPWNLTVPTGIFYLTTQTEVNNLMCPSLALPIPANLVPFSVHPSIPKFLSLFFKSN